MSDTTIQFESGDDNATIHPTQSVHFHTEAQNTYIQDGCIKVVFSEMEYLPWDNPDNIVSAKVEIISRLITNNILALLFLIGGPANVINMVVFYKQSLKERVNLCLFALSLADELYLIMATLLHIEQVLSQFTTGETRLPMMTFLTNHNFQVFMGFCYVSPVLSAIIASERCHCVLSPLKYQTFMQTRAMALIIFLVYVLTLGLCFIVSFRYRIGCVYDPVSGVVLNVPIMGEFYKAHKQFIDMLHSFAFGIGLPVVLIVVVTTTTIITAVKLRQIVTWRAGTSSSISDREVALTKMLIGSSIFFLACIFPNALTRLTWLLFPEMNSGGRNQNFFLTSLWISEVFLFINSSFNILVYYAMGSRYRETFWELFIRKRKPEHKVIL